jgi:4-hydroxy-3-methylbut-2-enyl diphosphate reductase IspH
VDLMVVVGGKSSANTKELTRLCEISGKHAIQIQGVADLIDAAPFRGATVVGVTGGTSTPIEDLRDVAHWILAQAGTTATQAQAEALANAALADAATPAGRTTSLPTPPRIAAAGAA